MPYLKERHNQGRIDAIMVRDYTTLCQF